MVVAIHVGVEPRSAAGMARAGDHVELHQHLEHAVHRGARNARKPRCDFTVNVLGGGVIVSTQHGVENGPPLHGNAHTSIPAAPLESGQTLQYLIGCQHVFGKLYQMRSYINYETRPVTADAGPTPPRATRHPRRLLAQRNGQALSACPLFLFVLR